MPMQALSCELIDGVYDGPKLTEASMVCCYLIKVILQVQWHKCNGACRKAEKLPYTAL